MKKILTIATAVIMVMSMMILAGCGSSDSEDNAEKPAVYVSAAASLTVPSMRSSPSTKRTPNAPSHLATRAPETWYSR